MAFSCIMDYFKTGNIPPNVVSKAFNFCHAIHNKSNNQNNMAESSQNSLKISNRKGEVKRIKEHVQWIEDIHNIAEEFLLHNLNNFDTERTIILSYLFTYTEAILELLLRPKKQIISLVHRYLRDYISLSNDSLNSDDIIALNQMIIIAGRFTIREASIVKETGTLYRLMLQKTDRLSTVNNIIVCITDLCQMHMQIVELVLGEILSKLKSEHFEVRLVTFNSLAQIILQDFLKLRDNLFLIFLATLLDTNLEISNRATEFFMEYLQKKNSVLFQNCLLECPFIFNEYLVGCLFFPVVI